MEIGLVYSGKDPRQIETRNFVRTFVKEHGISARIIETERAVDVPTVSINGCCITEPSPITAVKTTRIRFPSLDDIARALERNIWSL